MDSSVDDENFFAECLWDVEMTDNVLKWFRKTRKKNLYVERTLRCC